MRTIADQKTAEDNFFNRSLSKTNAALQGLPYGFIEGGALSLSKDYKVSVAPFVCNVKGLQIKRTESYQIIPGDWVVSLVAKQWYYIYITDANMFYVDSIEPVYNTAYFAYYHIEKDNWRNMGKFYVDTNSEVAFVQSKFTKVNNEVAISSVDCSGDGADYYCDETNNELFFNKAVLYLSEVYGGGDIYTSTGNFYFHGTVNLKSNIGIIGEQGTVFIFDYDGTAILADGSALGDFTKITLESFSITNIKASISTRYLMNIEYCDNLLIKNIYFFRTGSDVRGARIFYCRNYIFTQNICYEILYCSNNYSSGIVSNNIFDGNSTYPFRFACIFTADTVQIVNNQFINIYFDSGLNASVLDVSSSSNEQALIQGNIFSNISDVRATYTTYGILIGGNNTVVLDNYLTDFKGWRATAQRLTAIFVGDGSYNTLISRNMIFDISGIGINVYTGAEQTRVLDNVVKNCGNLVIDGDCENTTAPYFDTASSLSNALEARDATVKYKGTYSRKLTKNVAAGTEGYIVFADNETADMHGLYNSITYTLRLYVYRATAGGVGTANAILYLDHYTGGVWVNLASDASSATSLDGWEELTITGTIGAAATGVRGRLAIGQAEASGDYINYDCVQLRVDNFTNVHSTAFTDSGTDTVIL